MRKLLALAAALAAAIAAPTAFATHGGAELIAKGSGSTEFPTTQTQPIVFFCLTTFSFQTVGQIRTTTLTKEQFDFSSRLGDHEATDPFGEPHGQMRIEYDFSRTVVVDYDPAAYFNCLGASAPPDQTSTTRQFATASATVTCLTVVNNRAVIGGRVDRFDGNLTPTRGLVFNATDNTIAGQQVGLDRFAAAFVAEAPQACPAPSADHPINSGYVTVQQG